MYMYTCHMLTEAIMVLSFGFPKIECFYKVYTLTQSKTANERCWLGVWYDHSLQGKVRE